MRFPNSGPVYTPQKPEHLSVEDDMLLAEQEIAKASREIELQEKKLLSPDYSTIEKEQLRKKLVLLRIDLAESQTRLTYLKEEGTVEKEAANEEMVGEGAKAA